MSTSRLLTLAGLVAGAAGIAILWGSGITFPVYPPPGIILLVAGALFVGLVTRRWAPAVGAFLGLFVIVGFLLSPTGVPNFVGDQGTSVAIGSWIQVAGVVTAFVAGTITTVTNYRRTSAPRKQR
jgi:hypothetical protein